jgi:hypothetical protein
MRIAVTRDDIDADYTDGYLADECMVARALSRALGVPVSVSGCSDGSDWYARLGAVAVRLPRWVGDLGVAWQEEPRQVQPFVFTLKLTHAWPQLPESVRSVVRTYGGRAPLLSLLEAS